VRVGGYDTSGGDTNRPAVGVAVSGNYAYVVDGSAGLQVIDVRNPENPVRVGGYDTSGWANGVAVSGNYVFVADGQWGLQIFRIGEGAPRIESIDFSGESVTMIYRGRLLWAEEVIGPYSVVVGADSPYSVSPSDKQRFFKVE
jgi:hypothetical protein